MFTSPFSSSPLPFSFLPLNPSPFLVPVPPSYPSLSSSLPLSIHLLAPLFFQSVNYLSTPLIRLPFPFFSLASIFCHSFLSLGTLLFHFLLSFSPLLSFLFYPFALPHPTYYFHFCQSCSLAMTEEPFFKARAVA